MKAIVGWREWAELPGLELPPIKAKIDTGARSSCLHAFESQVFERDGQHWVRFGMHPYQNDSETEVYCEALVVDERLVTDSGGHTEKRIVISTTLRLGRWSGDVEMTLTNRDTMRFRMLVGRTTLVKADFGVDPAESYLLGKKNRRRNS